MGKVSKKSNGNVKSKKASLKGKKSPLSLEEVVEKVHEKINVFDYEEARSYCNCGLETYPGDLELLELSSNCCLEIGNFEEAKNSLEKAIIIQPEKGHTKYFSLAQLLEGQSALECYKKGIEIISNAISELTPSTNGVLVKVNGNIKNTFGNESSVNSVGEENPKPKRTAEEAVLYHQLSSGYCSIAELFTSELCDEDGAENLCLENIELAITADDNNPEAYIQQANFRLIKEDDKAKESILKSISLWLPKYIAIEEGEEASGGPLEDACPISEELRIQTAKILIEVEEYDKATDVLEGLLEEDDQNVQVWYLMGWNFYMQGNDFKALSKQHLKKALWVHDNVSPCFDDQLISHIDELLVEMKDVEDIDSEKEMGDSTDEDETEEMEINE